MLLRELRVRGFKSFAHSTVLRFGRKITGIIGPNGCGKSNLVDALRWVLGEQKAKVLRSERMEDLIFQGSAVRKGYGMAEVSLVIDNTKHLLSSHYTEAMITRRVYKGSESEFEINGVRSRLRDITDLILDSGISFGPYSIIELKMVEDVLNDKDNTRETLLSQAAGTLKYKLRKQEVLTKLSHTEADMGRVNDMLHELDGHLDSLRSQAQKASRYKHLQDSYASISLEVFLRKKKEQEKTLQALSKEKEQMENQQSVLSGDIRKQQSVLEGLSISHTDKQKALQGLSEAHHSVRKDITEKEEAWHSMEREKVLLQSRIKDAAARLLSYQAGHKRKAAARERLGVQWEESKQAYKDASDVLEEIVKEKEAAKQLYVAAKTAWEASRERVASTRQSLEALKIGIRGNEEKKAHILNQIALFSQERLMKKKNITLLQEAREVASKNHQLLYEKKAEWAKKVSQQAQYCEQMSEEAEVLKVSFEKQVQREALLKEKRDFLVQQLQEGGGSGAWQYLRQDRSWQAGEGMVPLVMEVLQVSVDAQKAVLDYLGEYAQYFVVRREAEAWGAIRLLSEKKKGKAGFFVLEAIARAKRTWNGNDWRDSVSEKRIGAESLWDKITCERGYERLFHFLFQDVYIYPHGQGCSLSCAMSLGSGGDYFSGSVYCRGGIEAKKEEKEVWRLGIQAQLRELDSEIKRMEESGRQIKERWSTQGVVCEKAHKDWTEMKKKDEELGVALQRCDKEIIETRIQWKNGQEGVEKEEERKKQWDKEVETLLVLLQSQNQELVVLTERFGAYEKAEQEQEKAYERSQSALLAHEEKNQGAYIAKERRFARLTQQEKELHWHKESLENLQESQLQDTRTKEEAHHALEALTQAQSKQEIARKAVYEKEEALRLQIEVAEKDFFVREEAIKQAQSKVMAMSQRQQNLHVLCKELVLRMAHLQQEQKEHQARIEASTSLSIDEIAPLPEAQALSDAALTKKKADYSEQLNESGNINWLASENYQKMKERHAFVSKEKEDLLQARENLLQSMEKIDRTVKKRFTKAFDAISAYFQQTFQVLFGEKSVAALTWTQNEGSRARIDITAQPKGKKPAHIEQLSSGEKTLTTLAFLIAIYLYKPSPFCVLDEVDAPLDDLNTDKFCTLLKEMSAKAQFIVITHNKRTMQYCDVLQGFTMWEAGITQVLPTQIEKLKMPT